MSIEREIQDMVDRETRAWDQQDAAALVALFHPDMVWPWPPDPEAHDPVRWVFPQGRFDRARWQAGWEELFRTHVLVHNRRRTVRIAVSEERDGAIAVVDVDTLWRRRADGAPFHWKGRACKGYARVGGKWLLIYHTGLLDYPDERAADIGGIRRMLCYGDSNTWGYEPGTGARLDRSTRWSGVLGQRLGTDWEVVEEGLCGRTTTRDDPLEDHRNGASYLVPCLESHRPLDLVVLLLGTNDLKARFGASAAQIADGAAALVRLVQQSDAGVDGEAPPVLLLSPPPLAKLTQFAEMFGGAEAKSWAFSAEYGRVARETGCGFLDTSGVVASSPVDGIHLDRAAHRALGEAVASAVQSLFPVSTPMSKSLPE